MNKRNWREAQLFSVVCCSWFSKLNNQIEDIVCCMHAELQTVKSHVSDTVLASWLSSWSEWYSFSCKIILHHSWCKYREEDEGEAGGTVPLILSMPSSATDSFNHVTQSTWVGDAFIPSAIRLYTTTAPSSSNSH